MMTKLDQFAETLVRCGRDRAIAACDALINGGVHGPQGRRWSAAVATPSGRNALELHVPDLVDEVMFQLLAAIDGGELPLMLEDEPKENVSAAGPIR